MAHSPNDLPLEELTARSNRRFRIILSAFATVLLISIIVSVELSTLDLNFSSFLYGSDTVWLNHRAAFRVGAVDAQTHRPLSPLSIVARVKDGDALVNETHVEGPGVVDLSLRMPPAASPAGLTLEVSVTTSMGTDTFSVPLRPVTRPPPLTPLSRPHWELLDKKTPAPSPPVNGYLLEVFPEAGHLVFGLPNKLRGRLLHHGQPTSLPITLSRHPGPLTPSPEGVFTFPWTPFIKADPLNFTVTSVPPTSLSLRLKASPTQLLLHTDTPPIVPPGATVDATVQSLPFRGPVHIDVWAGEVLLLTTSEQPLRGLLEFQLALPKDFEGLLRIDAYKNFMAPQGTLTSRHLLVSSRPHKEATETLRSTLSALEETPALNALRDATSDATERALLPLVLSRLFPEVEGAPLLRSTLAARRAQVTDEREGLRADVHRLFITSVMLGFLLLGLWVFLHRRGVRDAVSRVVQEGIAEGEEWEADAITRLSQISGTSGMLITAGAIGMSLYAIYVMLTRLMNWGW